VKADGGALLDLATSVADGAPVDWRDLERSVASEADLGVLRQLRVVAGIAQLHRSFTDDAVEPIAPPPGRTGIGRWGDLVLLERVGTGAFGEVYRGWDARLEREVALKLLRRDASDPVVARRVLEEGRLLARVRHPHVVSVYGADVRDGRVGLWMEFIDGETLERRVEREGPLSAREALLVGLELCGALAAVHQAGVVHRDVKAQNVMREAGGRLVLMDFGAGEESASRPGALPSFAGTPLYLAPELLLALTSLPPLTLPPALHSRTLTPSTSFFSTW